MPSIQPDGLMNPDPLGRLTDALVADLRALLPPDKQDIAERLIRTFSDWATEIISRSSAQSASAFLTAYTELKRDIAQTNRRMDRRKTKQASLESVVEDLRDRIVMLERHVGGSNGGRD